MSSPAAFFISDAHLGAEPEVREAVRERLLHAFLTSLVGRATDVFIVGDLFDFWFEYATAIPRRCFATLCVLRRLRESGVRITYLAGNHDFWLGPFLRDEMGFVTHDGAVALELQGRRVWLHHGDGLIGGDLGYRVLKRVLRSPASIALYRLLHPDLGIPIARVASRWSRDAREAKARSSAAGPDDERLVREVAEPRFREGHDAVLVGHFHRWFERREGGRDFFVLGDWMELFTYVELRDGVFRPGRWPSA
jgi:UDP-2,3-diacylglucosamine hydrolase